VAALEARVTALLLAVLLGALPEGSARYRFELAGEPIGVVSLAVRCEGPREPRCLARWESMTRLPAEAGGSIRTERFERLVDREGRVVAPGTKRARPPAFLLELLLRDASEQERCLEVEEERSGRIQQGCGRAVGGQVSITLDGEPERVTYRADGFPEQIALPAQRTRFVRDAHAAVPDLPPRLFGVEVEGPESQARGARFCGVLRDGPPAEAEVAAAVRLPAPAAPGANCREQAAAWIESAGGAGIVARNAVGIAWSGSGWSWHAWVEARVDQRWIPVDPAFGQSPARSPRFTIARWEPGDEAARSAAGRRILGCWGRARVEP
jgi:hypothetical protein